MGWSALGTQYCLELGFGVLFALAFVPRAPVGTLFYRILGTCAYLPILVAAVAPLAWSQATAHDPLVWAAWLVLPTFPFVSGPFRGLRWSLPLAWALAGATAAIAISVARNAALLGAGEIALGTLSAMATGAVAGSVSLAMVLGHWYLTIPNLDVAHLRRLNRVAALSMATSIALLGITCLLFSGRLEAGSSPLFGPRGLFHFGTRLAVGLALPLLFAWMTSSSLDFKNTRSATGILYASTILVLIGTAVSVSLQSTYGVPL
jgi:hypothetical protein